VLVLSHELFNRKSQTAIVMAITSQPQKAGLPVAFALPATQLPKPSWVKVTQVRTISVERLGKRLAALDSETLSSLVAGLLELIG
jgi:mRNA interferase MazF